MKALHWDPRVLQGCKNAVTLKIIITLLQYCVIVVIVIILIILRQDLTMQPWLAWNSLCKPGCLRTHQDPPTSASQVLVLKARATTPCYLYSFS